MKHNAHLLNTQHTEMTHKAQNAPAENWPHKIKYISFFLSLRMSIGLEFNVEMFSYTHTNTNLLQFIRIKIIICNIYVHQTISWYTITTRILLLFHLFSNF
jgi:hypothetical protein